MRLSLALCALAVAAPAVARAQPASTLQADIAVTSPNMVLIVKVKPVDAKATASPWHYHVSRAEGGIPAEILSWSPLGVVRDDASLVELRFVSATPPVVVTEVSEQRHGKQRTHSQEFTRRRITFDNAHGSRLILELRVGDDSVAFRYVFPETDAGLRRVKDERTGFAVPEGSRGWLLPHDPPGKWTPAYENFFVEVAAGAAAPTPQGWSYPALFKLHRSDGRPEPSGLTPSDLWLLITEAAVD